MLDTSNGIIPGSGGIVETLTLRDASKLSHLYSAADYVNDMYQDLFLRPGYNATRDFIHSTTRHTITVLQYCKTSFVTWFMRHSAPNCGWPDVYIRLATPDFLEHRFASYRSLLGDSVSIHDIDD